jgi:hypothetical protein
MRIVNDLLEEAEALMHPINAPILKQDLVVLGHGHHKEDAGNIVETMDPLFSFRPLASNIKHMEHKFLVLKLNLKFKKNDKKNQKKNQKKILAFFPLFYCKLNLND